jgi:hypothetical protein
MKKTIITSAILLFIQVVIFAQTPVVTTPTDAPAQTSKQEKGRGSNREKGQRGRDGKGKDQRERQSKMTAADRATQYSNQLKTALTLNDDQYQKVLAVNTECITRRDALRGGQEKGAMKTGKADIKAYRLGEFQKIFTADQMTAYQNMNDDKDDKEVNDDKDKDEDKGRGKGKDKDRRKGKGRDKEKDSKDDDEKKENN